MCVDGSFRHELAATAYAHGDELSLGCAVVASTHPLLIDAEHAVTLDFWTNGASRERLGVELDPAAARRLGESLIAMADALSTD